MDGQEGPEPTLRSRVGGLIIGILTLQSSVGRLRLRNHDETGSSELEQRIEAERTGNVLFVGALVIMAIAVAILWLITRSAPFAGGAILLGFVFLLILRRAFVADRLHARSRE